jgi:hypothetical protein
VVMIKSFDQIYIFHSEGIRTKEFQRTTKGFCIKRNLLVFNFFKIVSKAVSCQRTNTVELKVRILLCIDADAVAIVHSHNRKQSQSLRPHHAIMTFQFSSAILLLWVCSSSDPASTAEAWIPALQLATITASASTTRRSTSTFTTMPFVPRIGKGAVIAGMQLHSSSKANKGDSDKNEISSSNVNGGGENDDDEEECPDEEECDIDWSKMPGGGDDEQAEVSASASVNVSSPNHGKQGTEATAKKQNDEQIEEVNDDDDHAPNPPALIQVRNLRLRMEMQWQMTEAAVDCDVDNPSTCGSDPCQDCNGRGKIECRFCRGTTVLWMRQPGGVRGDGDNNNDTSSFSACNICQKGTEICRSCQGSGWVSGWAKLQISE